MKRIRVRKNRQELKPLLATDKLQAASMTLPPGATSDEQVANEHPLSEQWVYVLAGTASATVEVKRNTLRRLTLQPGALLVIEEGERHQIRNNGKSLLRILTFYSPPAYRTDGALRANKRATKRSSKK